MDEEDTGSEKVMVEKADLADGLLLELEEERSRSYNKYFCLFFQKPVNAQALRPHSQFCRILSLSQIGVTG